jgi:SAM-dependent methyltransferase
MDEISKQAIVENYRELLLKHGHGPEVAQLSKEGQQFRFDKLVQIADLNGQRVLDLGCGIGDLYPFLLNRFGNVDYTGIDIGSELITAAKVRYPATRFICKDVQEDGIGESFDFVLISGIFNNAIPNCTQFLKEMIELAFSHCSKGLAFNFISRHVNYLSPGMAYHDPSEILDFCITNMTRKVTMQHHYERCDVVVFAYR